MDTQADAKATRGLPCRGPNAATARQGANLTRIKATSWAVMAAATALLAVLFTLLSSGPSAPLAPIELWAHDAWVVAQWRHNTAERNLEKVVLIAIDDTSLAEFGRWPWDRRIIAQGLGKLASLGSPVIGIDLMFSEPSHDPASDRALAEALQQAVKAVLPVYAEAVRDTHLSEGPLLIQPRFPIPDIATAGAALGHIVVRTDSDGVVRHAPGPAWAYAGYSHPGLIQVPGFAAAVFAAQQGQPPSFPKRATPPVTLSAEEAVVSIPFHRLYAGELTAEETWLVATSPALLGVTAKGLYDFYPVATAGVRRMVPGAEIHALALAAMRNGFAVSYLPGWVAIVLGWASALAALAAVGAWGPLPGMAAALAASSAGLGAWLGAGYAWSAYFPLTPVFLSCASGYLAGLSRAFLRSQRERLAIRELFGRYVSDEVAREILAHQDYQRIGGRRAEITVMFADLRGFTRYARSASPDKVAETLNSYLSVMADVVLKAGGTLDKYTGDGVMAFFGAPVDDPHHPAKALLAAEAVMARLAELNRRRSALGLATLDAGIGVASGEAVVGNFGTERRMEFTAIGDPVNLAARLESVAGNAQILVDSRCVQRLKNLVHPSAQRLLGALRLRGRQEFHGISEPVEVWELEIAESEISGFEMSEPEHAGT